MTFPPELLDRGQSERGWHLLMSGLHCPQLRAYYTMAKSESHNFSLPEPEPLVRGGTAHIGMSHYFVRLQAIQAGEDPNRYYTPRDAVYAYQQKQDGRWFAGLPGDDRPVQHHKTVLVSEIAEKCAQCVDAFADWFGASGLAGRWKILMVEEQFRAHVSSLDQGTEWSLDPLVSSWLFTQRADLVYEDMQTGQIWILDWKTRAWADRRTERAYIRSGQFQGYRKFGEMAYGDRFGGVKIGFLTFKNGPGKKEMKRLQEAGETPKYQFEFSLVDVPVLPHRLADFERTIRWGERTWQDAERLCGTGPEDLWHYPKVNIDNGACETRFGECPGADYCDYGKMADQVVAEREAEQAWNRKHDKWGFEK